LLLLLPQVGPLCGPHHAQGAARWQHPLLRSN
jgi:hypothetical protein